MKGVLANLSTEVINSAISGLKNLGSAFVDISKQAVDSYAEFEQLEGGVKKIFGDDMASAVIENSQKAFETAGMSANDYLETVTGFSASLIQSLDGDTTKAVEISDRAIRDMSDNANTFGTSMESIQNAYQGFAKGNYTMLDNLKLGYGGTKEEMARLIKDASKMKDVQEELGITIDANDTSFGNIANAISVVQSNMGIMGTTSKEASTTIEGSTKAMKSAWQNMLTGMADENADFGALAKNFIGTLVTEDGKGGVLGTMIPRISQVITGVSEAMQTLLPELIETIVPIIEENLPILIEAIKGALAIVLDLLPEIIPLLTDLIPSIIETLLSFMPQLVNTGILLLEGLIEGLTDAIPMLIDMLPEIIDAIISTLLDNLPLLIEAGINLTWAIINGLIKAIPMLIDMLPEIIEAIVTTLIDNLPLIINAGIGITVALIRGILDATVQLVQAIPSIVRTIVNTLKNRKADIIQAGKNIMLQLISGLVGIISKLKEALNNIGNVIKSSITALATKMKQWGIDMVQGLIDGIKSMISKVGDAVGQVADKIKSFLHFSHPDEGALREYETWMPDFMQGMAKSLKESAPILIDEVEAIANGISGAMNLSGSIGSGLMAGAETSSSMVEAFKEALSDMKIELDDEVAGKFVEKTVARAIYT